MINQIFEYSKTNSKFPIYSLRGDANRLKEGQNNKYYRMSTIDKCFRVGYQKYNDQVKLLLAIVTTKEEYIDIVENSLKALSVFNENRVVHSKDRLGETVDKSWELEVVSSSIEGMFYLQEMLLNYYENLSNQSFHRTR